jgi:hypothetical protein
MKVKKLVYKYDDGGYYAWMGESISFAVKHVTNDPLEAADFSSYIHPEKDLPSEAGKLIWITGTFEEGEEYNRVKEEVTSE